MTGSRQAPFVGRDAPSSNEEPRSDEPRRDESQCEEPQREEPQRDETQHDTPGGDDPGLAEKPASAEIFVGNGRKVLMIAPEPVLQPRGTPMSVMHRLRALAALGYEVDLLTYPLGEDIELPGLTITRVPKPWGLTRIKIGPSVAKAVLDVFLFVAAASRLKGSNYFALHTHEDGALIGAMLARRFGVPHVYDMHSSLPTQFETWGKRYARWIGGVTRSIELEVLKRSDLVLTVYPALSTYVNARVPDVPVQLIENTAVNDRVPAEEEIREFRTRTGTIDRPTIVYTGNFEPYQGIDLLLDAIVLARKECPDLRLVLVGGEAPELARVGAEAARRGVADAVVLCGRMEPSKVPVALAAADVLVSPRVSGDNTPLKLYSYLAAGRPIVATDLPTHTQVLNEKLALLAEPSPQPFAAELVRALTDSTLAQSLSRATAAYARENLGPTTYTDRVAAAYRVLEVPSVPLPDTPSQPVRSPRTPASRTSSSRTPSPRPPSSGAS